VPIFRYDLKNLSDSDALESRRAIDIFFSARKIPAQIERITEDGTAHFLRIQVEENKFQFDLRGEDELCQARWSVPEIHDPKSTSLTFAEAVDDWKSGEQINKLDIRI
jgi:hypothetical protein